MNLCIYIFICVCIYTVYIFFLSDMNTMVELTSFQSLGRMQPFNVTMSSSAMAVIDVHAHVSTSEVVGYLAGQWDVTNHSKFIDI